MKLHEAFNIARGEVVAFIGAGGKTSTLMRLGHELADAGWRVLATTTTRIGEDQLKLMPYATKIDIGARALSDALSEHGFVFLYDDIRGGKVYGPPLEFIRDLLDSVDSDVLLIEADGARRLPLKAPRENEPVIPAETTLVVPVASLAVLGQPLDEAHVYNAAAIIERYGFAEGNSVKLPWVAQVLRDETLGLRGVPEKPRVAVFLNQTPAKGYLLRRARLIAQLTLRSPRVQSVVVGSARMGEPAHEVHRSVAVLILAAGLSSRMGAMKVLLPWAKEKTILQHIIEQVLLTRLTRITVVTGHEAEAVREVAGLMDVATAHNRAYQRGEMLSSLKAGLKALPEHVSAALVVLGDQPSLQPRVIGRILKAYAQNAGLIIAPYYGERRGHPVLFDRSLWPEILALRGDKAPRDLLKVHGDKIARVQVNSDSVLRDIDTPQDYDEERQRSGLH